MGKEIYVWDRFVRFFHWSLVVLFVTSYLTGDEQETIHVYSGYAIAVLVFLRVIWGFVGPKYARFSDFVYSPSTVIQYMKSMVKGSPRHYLGHNPAAGAMVIALLLTLVVITLSGMKLYAVEEGKGPFSVENEITLINVAHASSGEEEEYEDDEEQGDSHGNYEEEEEDEEHDEEEEFWEEIHEASVNFMLFLIVVHIGGVFFSGRQHKESLVKAMFTGKKVSEEE